ncbi:GNAT family N-acetyltransferase [Hoeflea sp. TYP-13]|uniref:GNAT family N-acetyltransferase n=1 Tax=Hoeflea sp. TYP-13 TaxID=3230023 RepID=UPI0034C5C65B
MSRGSDMNAGNEIKIVPYAATLKQAILDLSLRAWQPVFQEMKPQVLPFVYDAFYPDGWQARQVADIGEFLDREGERTWVARHSDKVLGFVGLRLHPEDKMGEVYVLAVDPDHQRQGVGATLMAFAEQQIRKAGMDIVMVETGGDPGHQPARAAYESAGYERWPVARYFKKISS